MQNVFKVHIHAKLFDILYIRYEMKWLRCRDGATQVNMLNEI